MAGLNLTPQEKDAAVKAITKAIGYAENGGAPNINNPSAGKTGEMKSIFQFEPATWKAYAKEYLGDANAPLTPDNETTVTMKKVSDLLDKGMNAKQIASIWNSGDENAYTGKFSDGSPSIGVNKQYGVKFNVPAYANTVNSYAKKFFTQDIATDPSQSQSPTATPAAQNTPPQPTTQPIAQTPPSASSGGLLGQIGSSLQSALPSLPQNTTGQAVS